MDLAHKEVDYYELLLVSRNAPVEVIRASYRTLMQKLKRHPDLGGDTATAALINEAYAVLCDARRRAEHDAYLAAIQPANVGGVGGLRSGPGRPAPASQSPQSACIFCGTTLKHSLIIAEGTACIACNSPLFPAANHRLEPTGQRAVARIDKNQELMFYTQWPQAAAFAGRIEDISLNGMRFSTGASMVQGQYIKIVSQILEAIARVSNFSSRRRGVSVTNVAGVSFITLRFYQSVGGFVSETI